MLNHPTPDKLHALKFTGMAQALNEQIDQREIEQLSFEQRLGLLSAISSKTEFVSGIATTHPLKNVGRTKSTTPPP